jgi:hypothetical protein
MELMHTVLEGPLKMQACIQATSQMAGWQPCSFTMKDNHKENIRNPPFDKSCKRDLEMMQTTISCTEKLMFT